MDRGWEECKEKDRVLGEREICRQGSQEEGEDTERLT